MTPTLYLAFVLAASIVIIIPGPTVLLVVGYGLSEGRKSLWALVVGVALGDAVACSCSLAGLGALLAASATAFTCIKYVGAVYLVYLGIVMIRSGNTPSQALSPSPAGKKLAHAFAVTAVNPKSILFFVAFLPQFVSPDASAAAQLALLGGTFVVLAAMNAVAYGYLSGVAGGRIQDPRTLGRLKRLGGGTLIGAGLLTAVARR